MGRQPSWREVADQLASRLENHAYCDEHPTVRPDDTCPFCRDRAAFQVWEAKSSATPNRTETAMKSNRLAGHMLPNEGRLYNQYGFLRRSGPATCSCGAQSEEMHSASARQRWHREHKDQVRQQSADA
jgi:hypothetical protein